MHLRGEGRGRCQAEHPVSWDKGRARPLSLAEGEPESPLKLPPGASTLPGRRTNNTALCFSHEWDTATKHLLWGRVSRVPFLAACRSLGSVFIAFPLAEPPIAAEVRASKDTWTMCLTPVESDGGEPEWLGQDGSIHLNCPSVLWASQEQTLAVKNKQ